jgi:nucleotide-binding universal stress UspA family protein
MCSRDSAIPAGALTQKLIRLAPCPVLIAKGGVNSFSPKKMLFTSSFFEENAEMLARVNEFARLFSSELHLLKVITPEKFEPTTYSKRAITEIAAKARITDYQLAIFNDYSVEEGVYRYATLESVDCICMCTHTKSGIFQLMHKSVAEEVLSGAHVPVLIFRLKENRVEEGVLFPD